MEGTPAGEAELRAALAMGASLRLSYADAGMTSGRAEALDAALVATAAADLGALMLSLAGFAAGTEIATERGLRQVEDLRPGDRLATRDGGLRPLRKAEPVRLGWRELGLMPPLRPVRLAAGAPGSNGPSRELVAAGAVRVLDPDGSAYVALASLAAAGRAEGSPATGADYICLLLDRPGSVLANGIWAEVAGLPATAGGRRAGRAVRQSVATAGRAP